MTRGRVDEQLARGGARRTPVERELHHASIVDEFQPARSWYQDHDNPTTHEEAQCGNHASCSRAEGHLLRREDTDHDASAACSGNEGHRARRGLKAHQRQTEGHVKNLEKVFQKLGEPARAEPCPGFDGIKQERQVPPGAAHARRPRRLPDPRCRFADRALRDRRLHRALSRWRRRSASLRSRTCSTTT